MYNDFTKARFLHQPRLEPPFRPRVFECGQAYVALSRAKNLSAVRIADFSASCIKADEKVIKFYRNLRYELPTMQTRLA